MACVASNLAAGNDNSPCKLSRPLPISDPTEAVGIVLKPGSDSTLEMSSYSTREGEKSLGQRGFVGDLINPSRSPFPLNSSFRQELCPQ